MPLIAVLGGLGSGKTLFLTWQGLKYSKNPNHEVYANFHIFKPEIRFISPLDFVKLSQTTRKDKHYIVLLDELYGWLDSRCSASKVNRLLDVIGLQSRKLNMVIFYSAQLGSTIDLRYREITDIVVKCEQIPKYGFYYEVYRQTWKGVKKRKFFLPLWVAKMFWQYYDTSEIIKPIGLNKLIAELEEIENPTVKKGGKKN
jgi:hypothetical protein